MMHKLSAIKTDNQPSIMSKILCFGEILWDAFGDEKVAGGAPMNVARHLAQQGADVLFASRVGSDESGKGLIEFLKQGGLYSSLVQTDNDLPTCEVTVQLDAHGHATYIIPQPVSWDNIRPEAALDDAAKHGKRHAARSMGQPLPRWHRRDGARVRR